MNEKIISQVANGIGWIIYNNAAKRNAMSFDMVKRAADCIKEHEENDHHYNNHRKGQQIHPTGYRQ